MSNISGDTFFIENSVNCSDLGTINGSVSFLDTSSNCGQVLNAIFSGGVNCGQACGCTVFYNSCNFGYICGTGILRGNSVLYGAADCVIQCDQSTIDAGASVVSCEFLVTTGTPTNIYSNDSCYYTYSNGVSTLATGAWSNGYFSSGSACQTLWDNVVALLTACAQDSNLYYEYADYSTCIANGTYKNGYFCSGLLVNVVDRGYPDYDPNFCILYPIKAVPGASTSEYAQYCCDGTPSEYEDGLYILRDGSISFIQNKGSLIPIFQNTISIHKIKNTCPAVQGNFYWLFYNNASCCLYATSDSYVTSSGYFSVDAGVDLGLGGNRDVLRIEASYTSGTPASAIDDNLYYIYCTGVPSLASGLYSNFAINGGVIDCSYSTNMPTGGIDYGCYIYENGCALNVENIYNILDDNFYYGTDLYSTSNADPYFPNIGDLGYGVFDVKTYKSNNNTAALIVYHISPHCRVDITSMYTEGGAYFTYWNDSFKVCNAYQFTFDIQTGFNSKTPYSTIPDRYFIYCNGSGVIPNGIYTNYAFTGSFTIDYNYNCLLPQQPLDDVECANTPPYYCSGKYYVYTGGTGYGATGAYSNFYYCYDFTKDTQYNYTGIGSPEAAQDDCKYYQYYEGCPFIVTGCRNDAPGYNGYPSGIYNFGDNGEYNPNPCFIEYKNGPYVYTYYCADVPFSSTGVVLFGASISICCGPGLGITDPKCYWIYHSTICCGYDPSPLGYSNNNFDHFNRHTCTCLTECSSTETYCCSYYCNNQICSDGIVMINDRFYLNPLTPNGGEGPLFYCGLINMQYICCTYWACQDLYNPLYCTCYYDLFDENQNCTGQGECQVCCGQECCGSEVTCNLSCIYYNAIGFNDGYITGYHIYLCINDNATVTCDSLEIRYNEENYNLNYEMRLAYSLTQIKFIDLV